jgi:NAD(P)-dependent dehydrogenase (short-subunit alcohol dehydrogenase family)
MTILITGANRGIGAGWSRPTVLTGQEVIAAARSGTDAVLDVTDPASIRALADGLSGRAIDLLVCNAGVYLDKGMSLRTASTPTHGRIPSPSMSPASS